MPQCDQLVMVVRDQQLSQFNSSDLETACLEGQSDEIAMVRERAEPVLCVMLIVSEGKHCEWYSQTHSHAPLVSHSIAARYRLALHCKYHS